MHLGQYVCMHCMHFEICNNVQKNLFAVERKRPRWFQKYVYNRFEITDCYLAKLQCKVFAIYLDMRYSCSSIVLLRETSSTRWPEYQDFKVKKYVAHPPSLLEI